MMWYWCIALAVGFFILGKLYSDHRKDKECDECRTYYKAFYKERGHK